MTAPLYVLDSPAHLATVVRRLNGGGWTIRPGLTLPAEPWDLHPVRTVVTGTVNDLPSAAAAVLAAARGVGVVVVADADTDAGRHLLADLERLGPVLRTPEVWDADAGSESGHEPSLTRDQQVLLRRLAAGESIQAAAEAEFLSLRTAKRRLAQACTQLGVNTTRQAVVEYARRHGNPD